MILGGPGWQAQLPGHARTWPWDAKANDEGGSLYLFAHGHCGPSDSDTVRASRTFLCFYSFLLLTFRFQDVGAWRGTFDSLPGLS